MHRTLRFQMLSLRPTEIFILALPSFLKLGCSTGPTTLFMPGTGSKAPPVFHLACLAEAVCHCSWTPAFMESLQLHRYQSHEIIASVIAINILISCCYCYHYALILLLFRSTVSSITCVQVVIVVAHGGMPEPQSVGLVRKRLRVNIVE